MSINTTSVTCYLGLGSNLANDLGSPIEHIQQAVASLQQIPQIENVKCSSLYVSAPMGVLDQPDFINAVVETSTTLSAFELLAVCQQLEKQAKRQRLRHWGERSLDVDVLLYGNEQIYSEDLTIPHVGLTKRNFVLIPLLEINPTLTVNGQLLNELPTSQDWTGIRLYAPYQ